MHSMRVSQLSPKGGQHPLWGGGAKKRIEPGFPGDDLMDQSCLSYPPWSLPATYELKLLFEKEIPSCSNHLDSAKAAKLIS